MIGSKCFYGELLQIASLPKPSCPDFLTLATPCALYAMLRKNLASISLRFALLQRPSSSIANGPKN